MGEGSPTEGATRRSFLKTCSLEGCCLSKPDVKESMAVDVCAGVNVPQIDQDWASHSLLHLFEVDGAKLLPFGHDH